jgi:hypothetical protein
MKARQTVPLSATRLPARLTTGRPEAIDDAWNQAVESYELAQKAKSCPKRVRHLMDAIGWLGAAGWEMSSISDSMGPRAEMAADAHITGLIKRIRRTAAPCIRKNRRFP